MQTVKKSVLYSYEREKKREKEYIISINIHKITYYS